MAEGLGFEPSHNGFRDRRATATLALSVRGRDRGIRTLTGRILSPLSLPVGLYPHKRRIGDRTPPLDHISDTGLPPYFEVYGMYFLFTGLAPAKAPNPWELPSLVGCTNHKVWTFNSNNSRFLLFSPDALVYDIVPQVMTPRLTFVVSALQPRTLWRTNLAKHMHLLD